VDSRHTALRLYLGDEDVTVHYLELVLTDRQVLAVFEVKRGFRKQVDVLSFEYSQLFPSMECKDTPLTPQDGSIIIWMAFLRFIDGRKGHVLNFYNADQRDAFARRFDRLAGARGMQFDPRGPERALEEAMDAAARRPQDWAKAFERCVKAVDRLHDFYVFEQFRNRQPSAADEPIIHALTYSLRALRRNDPHRDVRDGVKEATHRLRTIVTAADDAGLDSSLYRQGLQLLAQAAPDIDVSNVLWHSQHPVEPQVTPTRATPELPTAEEILAEWEAGSGAADLARWREGMARYNAAPIENRAEMRASAEMMCAALTHYLRGSNILAGSPDTDGQLPQTIWNVLVASLIGNDQTTWDAEVERHVRLALAATRRAGLQPETLGGRGTLAKIFDDKGNQMLMVASLWRLSTSGPKSFSLADWFVAAPEERAWKLP
jgi:hypothetical protein